MKWPEKLKNSRSKLRRSPRITRPFSKWKKSEKIKSSWVGILIRFFRYETLTKEVRKLEGELADYNLTFDKLRAGARPEDILNMYEHVRVFSFLRVRGMLKLFIRCPTRDSELSWTNFLSREKPKKTRSMRSRLN